MLDFEQELKNFEPSVEIEEVEDVIRQKDLADVTDLMNELLQDFRQINRV